jgi:hypothetical protein
MQENSACRGKHMSVRLCAITAIVILLLLLLLLLLLTVVVRVKQSRYSLVVAQRVPGS